MANAIESRSHYLRKTSGLNEEVFDSLIILAAGDIEPKAIALGFQRVQDLVKQMAEGRTSRLIRLGFTQEEAHHLASLHTKNFM
ncbi:MAG: hypothetical protein H6625_10535 [Bdellovibrionaceae bacterium]|nr:hypothetical protein [Pseudobdellovibrionaceae bacterium]